MVCQQKCAQTLVSWESLSNLNGNRNCPVCGKEISAQAHIGVVVPLYKSQEHIDQLIDFVNHLDSTINGGITLTVVVDGCQKSEEEFDSQYKKLVPKVRIVSLSRNFGVGPALFAAMSNQNECFTIAFGSDLQEPRSLFVDFATELFSGESEIVLGSRISREDPWKDVLFAKIYWSLCRKLMFKDVPKGGFDVFGMNQVARKSLTEMSEHKTNITAQILWMGFKQKYYPFIRIARVEGKSTWSFGKKLTLFLDSFFSFWPSILSKVSITLLMVATMFLVLNKNAATSFGVLMLWLIVALLVLVQNSVLDRVFENSKNRPLYIIARLEQLKDRT